MVRNITPTFVITIQIMYLYLNGVFFLRKSLDILQFVWKINQKLKTLNVDEGKFVKYIGSLFRARADIWYRSVEDQIVSWDDLCCRLKKEFFPRNYEKLVKHQIKSRNQKKTETIGTFIAQIDDLI